MERYAQPSTCSDSHPGRTRPPHTRHRRSPGLGLLPSTAKLKEKRAYGLKARAASRAVWVLVFLVASSQATGALSWPDQSKLTHDAMRHAGGRGSFWGASARLTLRTSSDNFRWVQSATVKGTALEVGEVSGALVS